MTDFIEQDAIKTEATLMIRATSPGAVPIEAFLRAAREVAFVAAEVGRVLSASINTATDGTNGISGSTGGNGVISSVDAPQDDWGFGGTNGSGVWRIIGAECHGPQSIPKLADANERSTSGRGVVALLLAPPAGQQRVAQRVREGIRSIHARHDERPEGFSDAALRALRRVAAMTGKSVRISVSAGQGEGEAVALDENVAAQIDTWLLGQRDAIGTVEGMLEIISIHNRLRFTVYGREGLRIECLFPEALLGQVKGALGERVCIRGRVRYRRDGLPATVEARTVRVLQRQGQLPTVESLIGASQVGAVLR